MLEPIIRVGIMVVSSLSAMLGGYHDAKTNAPAPEHLTITAADIPQNSRLVFVPNTADAAFTLDSVIIGVGFHWQRAETQSFRGSLSIEPQADGHLLIVNEVPVEDYLKSVISSEMSANAGDEFLHAHAIISRSWLLNAITTDGREKQFSPTRTDDEIIMWYDREDHTDFDVCADDHCQRYQGVTRQTRPEVERAIDDTHGLVLWHDGAVVDARYSKCCGGVFEEFQNAWEPVPHAYLKAGRDLVPETPVPDLTNQATAAEWINGNPDAFCNTKDTAVLDQVLNNYDRETANFYRWKVTYTTDSLTRLVNRRTGRDFGRITALEPLERGTSGRITRLRIVGTQDTLIVGKELEIRRTLSPSHLYSSAFTVSTDGDTFTLTGAGWGHGVGFCQIGGAMMAHKGYSYPEIVLHYYPGATLHRLY